MHPKSEQQREEAFAVARQKGIDELMAMVNDVVKQTSGDIRAATTNLTGNRERLGEPSLGRVPSMFSSSEVKVFYPT